jgi:hypothetical protein
MDRIIAMNTFDRILARSKGQTKQFLILTRHFFKRLFINDVVSFEESMQEKIIALVAILAVFSGHFANVLICKYVWIQDENMSWVEKCHFLLFAMLVISFISLLEWDIIFPDSRDFANLMSLPLKLKTLFFSKFVSYFIFVCLFASGITSLSTIVFWMYLPQWQSHSMAFSLRFVAAHIFTVFAACLSVSFIFAFLIGILMTVLSRRIFNLFSVYIRSLMMIALVFLTSFFLFRIIDIPRMFPPLAALKQTNSPFLHLFPPMWFVGLYETLLGNNDPLFHSLAKWTVPAIALPIISFFLISASGYRKYLKKMWEVKYKRSHMDRIWEGLKARFCRIFLKNPIQKAVFYFFGITIKKSNVHRMRLASYMVVAVGIVLILLAARTGHLEDVSIYDQTLISIPFVLSFFLVFGIRAISNIPIAVEANWIFRLRETHDKKHYLIGFKKGVIFFAILPLFTALFAFYTFIWGWMFALLFCFYGFAISGLLAEVVFVGYRKIPFTCSCLPGKGKVQIFWIVYFILLILYVSIMSSVAYKLLLNPSGFFWFVAVALVIFVTIRFVQNRFLLPRTAIIYEEKPEPALLTLVPES